MCSRRYHRRNTVRLPRHLLHCLRLMPTKIISILSFCAWARELHQASVSCETRPSVPFVVHTLPNQANVECSGLKIIKLRFETSRHFSQWDPWDSQFYDLGHSSIFALNIHEIIGESISPAPDTAITTVRWRLSNAVVITIMLFLYWRRSFCSAQCRNRQESRTF
jgi:hypothetical protein